LHSYLDRFDEKPVNVLPFHSAQTGSLLLLCGDLELTGHSGWKSR